MEVLVVFVGRRPVVIIFILENRIMYQQGKCAQLYEKYKIESEIGRGASGVCYRVQHAKSKEVFAMKKIHISSMRKHSTREACSEVAILSKINHPHIIKLFESFSDDIYLYIIMQYAPKGDLHNMLKRRRIRRDVFSEGEIWEMARQLLTALEYLHSHNIIHRDVKTLNIFMDSQGKLYLGDLGVSKILKTDNGLYSRVGTPLYLAPEIIKYQKYDYKADIWGLGCVCYQLATLNHPFEGKNIITLGQSIVNVQPRQIESYSPELNCFIMDMLEKNASKRLGATELLKKYFKEGVAPEGKPVSQQNLEETKDRFLDRIAERSANLLKSNNIRRKIINNFLQVNDGIRQQNFSKEFERMPIAIKLGGNQKEVGKVSEKSFQETLQFTKKITNSGESKKYVEATHKTSYLNINSKDKKEKEACQLIKDRKDQFAKKEEPSGNLVEVGQKITGMPIFSSNKRMQVINSALQNSKSIKGLYAPCFSSIERKGEHKKTDISLMREDHKNTEMSVPDVNRLSSENQLQGSGKVVRIRPKSSIMTKDRHESTMKNIKKSVRRLQMDDMDRFVEIETRVLKRPEMIIL